MSKDKKLSPIQALPEELLLYTFSFLSPSARAKVSTVCTKWNRVATDPSLPPAKCIKPLFEETEVPDFRVKIEKTCDQILNVFAGEYDEEGVVIRVIGKNQQVNKKIFNLPDANHAKDAPWNTLPRRLGPDNHLIICMQKFTLQLREMIAWQDGEVSFLTSLLKETTIILFCPSDPEKELEELAELSSALMPLEADKQVVLVVNGTVDIGRYVSIRLEANDSLQSFTGRIQERIFSLRNNLEEKDVENNSYQKNDTRSRCIIS